MTHGKNLAVLARRGSLIGSVAIAAALVVPPVAANTEADHAAFDHSAQAHLLEELQGTKPTIVLVHGAWADASSWNSVIGILQEEGYTVVAPPDTLRGVAHDSAVLANYLKTITGPIVLVAHSYGGAVITNAATGNPNVKELVYVDAFMPAQGETLGQLASAKPGSCVLANPSDVFTFATDPSQPAGDPDLYLNVAASGDYPGFDRCFANFVAPSEAAQLAAEQRPLALGSLSEQSGVPAWATIPSWAQIGTEDHVIPPAELTFMAERAGSHIQYVTAGHLSMVARPWETARLITRAALATS